MQCERQLRWQHESYLEQPSWTTWFCREQVRVRRRLIETEKRYLKRERVDDALARGGNAPNDNMQVACKQCGEHMSQADVDAHVQSAHATELEEIASLRAGSSQSTSSSSDVTVARIVVDSDQVQYSCKAWLLRADTFGE